MNRKIVAAVVVIVFFALLGYAGYRSFLRSSSSADQILVPPAEPTNTPTPAPYDESVIMERGEAEQIARERGGESMYSPFVESDYQAALSSGKIIMLNFYADWCPICRAEAPAIEEAFAQLKDPRMVGFRVNFKDGDTDSAEKALASQFDVPYQHTKIFLRNGKETARYPDQWDQAAAAEALKKALQE